MFGNIRNLVSEAIDAFRVAKPTDKEIVKTYGEGIQDISVLAGGYGQTTASLNMFNKQYINAAYATELEKIKSYREISMMPEVSEVLEDAANESSQQDDLGKIFTLEITDDDLNANQNAVNNVQDAFEELFTNRLEVNKVIDDWMLSYFVDGRLYLENVIDINNKSGGILRVKKLPSETMDFAYDPRTGEIDWFIQYKGLNNTSFPDSFEHALAEQDKYITFHANQITYIDTGKYGRNRKDVIGFLDKVKQPYNQLKLLETSVIIYRIVRAPERFVFKVDVGNMPLDKATKYVEKVKQNMQKKVAYDPRTGNLSGEPEVISMLDNFFIPTSSTGRGSDITTVGGTSVGFKEMDDIYFFQRKLYRALKYPLSRVNVLQERTEGSLLIGSSMAGEITQDEVKWGRFLKKNQDRFTDALLDLFLMHLEFTGLKQEYDLDKAKFKLEMTTPNNYLDAMWQKEKDAKMQTFQSYSAFVDTGYFSKYYLLKNVLKMTDEEIEENVDGFIKDIELGLTKVEAPEELPQGIQDRLGPDGGAMFSGMDDGTAGATGMDNPTGEAPVKNGTPGAVPPAETGGGEAPMAEPNTPPTA